MTITRALCLTLLFGCASQGTPQETPTPMEEPKAGGAGGGTRMDARMATGGGGSGGGGSGGTGGTPVVAQDAAPVAVPDAAPADVTTIPPDAAPVMMGAFPKAQVLASKTELVASLDGFPEGVSWRADGSVFLCAPGLVRIAPDKKRFRLLPDSFRCLGTYPLADGSLLVSGAIGLSQVLPDGRVAVLAERDGANDLSVDRAGNVYFTHGGANVTRVTPAGVITTLGSIGGANGIEVDPDDRYLYVMQTGQGRIARFDLPKGNTLGEATTVFPDVANPDGCAFDAWGQLWCAFHNARAVGILDVKARQEVGRLPVNIMYSIQNLAFGGPNNDVLYVVGGRFGDNSQLVKFNVGAAGARNNPGASAYKAVRYLADKISERAY